MVGRPQKHLSVLGPPVRQLFAYVVLTLFVLFFFSGGLSYHFDLPFIGDRLKISFPDFNHDQEYRTLSAHEFPLDDPTRRVVIVGDLHGMYGSLRKLLENISYNSSSDVLIHVGDFLTKGPHVQSLETLAFMTSHNITGVRGNHDQQVIQWRSWIRWIHTQPGGPRWLNRIYARWVAEAGGDVDSDPEEWFEAQKRKDKENKWWKMIPKGWTLFDTHFAVAHGMSEEQNAYLISLPYAIHIPSAHAFIVHGGILPSNPQRKYDHASQPLARVPHLPKGSEKNKNKANDTLALRTLQEGAILTKVPQNTKPWNILNIRSVLNGKVIKNTDGKAWSKIWRQEMERCAGFNLELGGEEPKKKKNKKELLPCYPSTVLYGHAASRDLDVKRWSIGLDTGCVYERHLTALILGGKTVKKAHRTERVDRDGNDDENTNADAEASSDVVEFGDSHYGRIVSVRCP